LSPEQGPGRVDYLMEWMKVKKMKFLVSAFIITVVLVTDGAYTAGTPDRDIEYLAMKSRGLYLEALEYLRNWTIEETDPVTIETSIFRIDEINFLPEMTGPSIEALEAVRNRMKGPGDGLLKSRADIVLNRLYLKKGMIDKSEALLRGLSFLDFYVIGPFQRNGQNDFDAVQGPEKQWNLRDLCRGKNRDVTWFKSTLDREGVIQFGNYFKDVSNSLFYCARSITADTAGEYGLVLGKTGHTDIWLDGEKIFSSRDEHGFCHDQYVIKARLERGKHRLLIKAGDSYDGVRVSLRLVRSNGESVPQPPAEGTFADDHPAEGTSRPMGVKLFPALDAGSKSAPDGKGLFRAGYLYFMSGLSGDRDPRAMDILSSISTESPYYPHGCYYIAQSGETDDLREKYLKESLKYNPSGTESLHELADISISAGFIHGASAHVENINKIHAGSLYYFWDLARLFRKSGWDFRADITSEKLNGTPYPSPGAMLRADIARTAGDNHRAIDELVRLNEMNMYLRQYYEDLAKLYGESGMYERAEGCLLKAVTIYPDDVALRLALARLISMKLGHRQSLPFISAALKISPFNADALAALGNAYHAMGLAKQALHYLMKAYEHDPDNFDLREQAGHIAGKTDMTLPFRHGNLDGLKSDAERYNDEPAVVLLDETVFLVNTDGSYRKTVRKAVKINEESGLKDHREQYIVYEPSLETVERVKCLLTNNGRSIEIKERYRRELSDHESRLYYDLEAVIIPVAGAVPGSIIEIVYTVNSRSGSEYRNYFGEKIPVGGKYRALRTNIILAFPGNRKIYGRLRGMPPDSQVYKKINGSGLFHVSVDNSVPYRLEPAMPDESEVVPCVYFTSFRDWDEMHSWYSGLVKNRMRLSPEMKQKVSELRTGASGSLDIIGRIFSHVTGEIRYAGFEFGIGGIRPRRSDETYRSRMGDCKDISLVLAAMLREAGFTADIALVRTRDRGRAYLDVPFAGEFNHAICHVRYGPGKDDHMFLDGTAEHSGFMELPDDDRGVTALVVGDTGARFISTDEGGPYAENAVTAVTGVELKPNGDAFMKRRIIKSGSAAPESRYDGLDDETRLRRLNEYWNSVRPGSTVTGLKTLSGGPDSPADYQYEITVPGYAHPAGNDIIFGSFLIPSDFYRNYTMSRNRIFPVVLSGRMTTRVDITYIVPDGYEVFFLPRDDRLSGSGYSVEFSYKTGAGSIRVTSVIKIDALRVNRDEYGRFRNFARLINRKELENIILVKKTR